MRAHPTWQKPVDTSHDISTTTLCPSRTPFSSPHTSSNSTGQNTYHSHDLSISSLYKGTDLSTNTSPSARNPRSSTLGKITDLANIIIHAGPKASSIIGSEKSTGTQISAPLQIYKQIGFPRLRSTSAATSSLYAAGSLRTPFLQQGEYNTKQENKRKQR